MKSSHSVSFKEYLQGVEMKVTRATHKHTLKSAIVAACLAIASPAIMADELKGEGEFGATASSGNTDTQNLLAKLKLSKKTGAWFNEVGLAAINSTDADSTTAERYLIAGKTARDFNEKYYAFGSGKYDKDRFSGYDYQATIAAGLGIHAIKTDKVTLDLEAGPGYRFSETDAGVSEDEAVLRAGLFYKNQITQSTKFLQNLVVEAGSDNTTIDSETALTVKMSDSLALKASVLVKNNSDVPVGTKKTDTLTGVSLIYGF